MGARPRTISRRFVTNQGRVRAIDRSPASPAIMAVAPPDTVSDRRLGLFSQRHNIIRTYAVVVQGLRQSGTYSFSCVRFCRAPRGKTAHKRMNMYHAAAGEKH